MGTQSLRGPLNRPKITISIIRGLHLAGGGCARAPRAHRVKTELFVELVIKK